MELQAIRVHCERDTLLQMKMRSTTFSGFLKKNSILHITSVFCAEHFDIASG